LRIEGIPRVVLASRADEDFRKSRRQGGGVSMVS
jgi:hypothetical protein